MRFITADYLFPLHRKPVKNGILCVSKEGEVLNIYDNNSSIKDKKIEYYKGIICPGFINAHCHLELSHLKSFVEEGVGLLSFIKKIKHRNSFSESEILSSIRDADKQMKKNGIVAVGDICNSTDTIFIKKKSTIKYYNFIETFSVYDTNVDEKLSNAKLIRNKFRSQGLKATITPHSPYSTTPSLLKKICEEIDSSDDIITFHNQESESENKLFKLKKGELYEWLKKIGSSPSIWEDRLLSPTLSVSSYFKEKIKLLLVHNTHTTKNDLIDEYYCVCPSSNLYIENSLPDFNIFNNKKLCVGTDSLASNHHLSILDEIKIIERNTNFDLNTLLKIASKNAALAFSFDNLGTFENNKKPGINLITNIHNFKLTAKSKVVRIY